MRIFAEETVMTLFTEEGRLPDSINIVYVFRNSLEASWHYKLGVHRPGVRDETAHTVVIRL